MNTCALRLQLIPQTSHSMKPLSIQTNPALSNTLTMNWLAIGDHRFLMTHFNHRPQTGFLILKSPANHHNHPNFKSTIFKQYKKNIFLSQPDRYDSFFFGEAVTTESKFRDHVFCPGASGHAL